MFTEDKKKDRSILSGPDAAVNEKHWNSKAACDNAGEEMPP